MKKKFKFPGRVDFPQKSDLVTLLKVHFFDRI